MSKRSVGEHLLSILPEHQRGSGNMTDFIGAVGEYMQELKDSIESFDFMRDYKNSTSTEVKQTLSERGYQLPRGLAEDTQRRILRDIVEFNRKHGTTDAIKFAFSLVGFNANINHAWVYDQETADKGYLRSPEDDSVFQYDLDQFLYTHMVYGDETLTPSGAYLKGKTFFGLNGEETKNYEIRGEHYDDISKDPNVANYQVTKTPYVVVRFDDGTIQGELGDEYKTGEYSLTEQFDLINEIADYFMRSGNRPSTVRVIGIVNVQKIDETPVKILDVLDHPPTYHDDGGDIATDSYSTQDTFFSHIPYHDASGRFLFGDDTFGIKEDFKLVVTGGVGLEFLEFPYDPQDKANSDIAKLVETYDLGKTPIVLGETRIGMYGLVAVGDVSLYKKYLNTTTPIPLGSYAAEYEPNYNMIADRNTTLIGESNVVIPFIGDDINITPTQRINVQRWFRDEAGFVYDADLVELEINQSWSYRSAYDNNLVEYLYFVPDSQMSRNMVGVGTELVTQEKIVRAEFDGTVLTPSTTHLSTRWLDFGTSVEKVYVAVKNRDTLLQFANPTATAVTTPQTITEHSNLIHEKIVQDGWSLFIVSVPSGNTRLRLSTISTSNERLFSVKPYVGIQSQLNTGWTDNGDGSYTVVSNTTELYGGVYKDSIDVMNVQTELPEGYSIDTTAGKIELRDNCRFVKTQLSGLNIGSDYLIKLRTNNHARVVVDAAAADSYTSGDVISDGSGTRYVGFTATSTSTTLYVWASQTTGFEPLLIDDLCLVDKQANRLETNFSTTFQVPSKTPLRLTLNTADFNAVSGYTVTLTRTRDDAVLNYEGLVTTSDYSMDFVTEIGNFGELEEVTLTITHSGGITDPSIYAVLSELRVETVGVVGDLVFDDPRFGLGGFYFVEYNAEMHHGDIIVDNSQSTEVPHKNISRSVVLHTGEDTSSIHFKKIPEEGYVDATVSDLNIRMISQDLFTRFIREYDSVSTSWAQRLNELSKPTEKQLMMLDRTVILSGDFLIHMSIDIPFGAPDSTLFDAGSLELHYENNELVMNLAIGSHEFRHTMTTRKVDIVISRNIGVTEFRVNSTLVGSASEVALPHEFRYLFAAVAIQDGVNVFSRHSSVDVFKLNIYTQTEMLEFQFNEPFKNTQLSHDTSTKLTLLNETNSNTNNWIEKNSQIFIPSGTGYMSSEPIGLVGDYRFEIDIVGSAKKPSGVFVDGQSLQIETVQRDNMFDVISVTYLATTKELSTDRLTSGGLTLVVECVGSVLRVFDKKTPHLFVEFINATVEVVIEKLLGNATVETHYIGATGLRVFTNNKIPDLIYDFTTQGNTHSNLSTGLFGAISNNGTTDDWKYSDEIHGSFHDLVRLVEIENSEEVQLTRRDGLG